MTSTPVAGTVLNISDIVASTFTNADGLKLLLAMQAALTAQDGSVTISMQGLTAFSSSFLNSSFGALYEQQGAAVMHRLRLTNYKPAQLKQLKEYLADVARLHQAD